ncbi:MAG TPA: hypothetical protein VFN53_03865 [Acidobacteriaceae bacterium]|nr:hypothetical protein [Acidobacteriaceae bacterium]
MVCKQIVRASNPFAVALWGMLFLAGLTACGSGNSSKSAGTTVTASFQGDTMPSGVAYQSGATGQFQTLTLSGSKASFTLPIGITAYGFAYTCPGGGSGPTQESILQATTTDTAVLSFRCPAPGSGRVTAKFNVSAIPGATGAVLWGGEWWKRG